MQTIDSINELYNLVCTTSDQLCRENRQLEYEDSYSYVSAIAIVVLKQSELAKFFAGIYAKRHHAQDETLLCRITELSHRIDNPECETQLKKTYAEKGRSAKIIEQYRSAVTAFGNSDKTDAGLSDEIIVLTEACLKTINDVRTKNSIRNPDENEIIGLYALMFVLICGQNAKCESKMKDVFENLLATLQKGRKIDRRKYEILFYMQVLRQKEMFEQKPWDEALNSIVLSLNRKIFYSKKDRVKNLITKKVCVSLVNGIHAR